MRKKFTSIGIWFLLAILFESCAKEERYDVQQGSHAGKQLFDYTENNVAAFMSFFDLALRVNAYMVLPEEQRTESRDLYFPDYQIEQDEQRNWFGVKEQDTVFKIVSDDLTLTTETAVWEISGCCDAYRGAMTITCTGLRQWDLEITSVQNGGWVSDAHIKIQHQGEQIPMNFNQGDWVVSGSGKSISENDYNGGISILDFEVAETLIKIANSQYLFDRGTLFIHLNHLLQQREDVIKAELKSYAGHGRQLKITFQGEIYSYNDDTETLLFSKDKMK